MTALDYLQEGGSGAFRRYRVPDLLSTTGQIELLFVLESPHVDEIRCGLPASGKAGRDALRFLMQTTTMVGALGPFVAARHAKGDGRLAILNVSELPLQIAAFTETAMPPSLSQDDWNLLQKVRARRTPRIDNIRDPQLRRASALLLRSFQNRVDSLTFATDAAVVIAGNFSHLHWDSLSAAPIASVLRVPHPSIDQWNRLSTPATSELTELRRLFSLSSA